MTLSETPPPAHEWPRYAIYFVPAAESNLYRCGSAILGYDCYTGEATDFPDEFRVDAVRWSALTRAPRRYGFHATLKAPFHLSPSCTEAQLAGKLADFADRGLAPRQIFPLVDVLDGFIAIVPRERERTLDALAASCTTIFDAFRAPMLAPERARRLTSGLNDRQIQNLERWGYPYVLADFRFHMTLTGRVEPRQHRRIVPLLQDCLRRMGADQPTPIDRLALVRQDTPAAAFRVVNAAILRPA